MYEAKLIELSVESAAWGKHVMAFTSCLRTLLKMPRRTSKQRLLGLPCVCAGLLFVIGTVDVFFLLYQMLEGFVYSKDNCGTYVEFSRLSNYVAVLRVSRPHNLYYTLHLTIKSASVYGTF